MMAPDSPTVMTALQSKNFAVLAQLLAETKEISSELLRQIKTYEKELFDAIILASNDIMHARGHNLLQATQSSSALHQVFQNSTHFAALKARHDLFCSRSQDFALSEDIKEFPNFPRGFYSEAQLRRNEQFLVTLKKHSDLLAQCLNKNRSKAFATYIRSIQPHPFPGNYPRDISNLMPEQVLAYTGQKENLTFAFEQLRNRKTARSGEAYLSSSQSKLDKLDEFVTGWHSDFLHHSAGLMTYGDDIKAVANYFNTRRMTVDAIYEYDGWHKHYFITHWAVHCRQENFFKDVNQRRPINEQIRTTYRNIANFVLELDVLYQQYLFIAVRLNYPEFIEIILNAAREDGVTQGKLSKMIVRALGYAVLYRRFEIFQLLLSNNLNATPAIDTILFSILSLKIGHVEFLNLALEKLYPQGLGQVKWFYNAQNNRFGDSGFGTSLIENACEEGQHVLTILRLLEAGAHLRTPDTTKSKSRRERILEFSKNNKALHCLIEPQVRIIETIDKLCSFALNPRTPYLIGFERATQLSSEEKALQDSILSKIPSWHKWSQTSFYSRRELVLEIIKEIESGLKTMKGKETFFVKKLIEFNNELQWLVGQMPESREDALNKLQEELRLHNEQLVSAQKSFSQKTTFNSQSWSVGNTYRWFTNFLDDLDGVSSGMITARGPSLAAPAAAVVKQPLLPNPSEKTVTVDPQKPVLPSVPLGEPDGSNSVEQSENAVEKNPRQILPG